MNFTTGSILITDLQPQRFRFLDSLRGIAALYVTIFHFYSILKDKTDFILPSLLNSILLEGTIGVQIFFVLSGFVIAYSIYRQDINLSFLGKFFIRRSVRLDPPYWMALFLSLLGALFSITFFTKPVETLPSAGEILANLFYLQDFLQIERIIHVSWTLCMEIQLYLFFVALTGTLLWIQKVCNLKIKEKVFDTPIFLWVFGILFLFSLIQNLPIFPLVPGLFTPYWYPFFLGSLLCWVYMDALSVRYYWMCCTLMIGFLWYAPIKQMEEILVISLMIYTVGFKNRLHDLLTFQPFQYLGKISYSLYLTHWLFAGKFMDAMARRFAEEMDMTTGVVLLMLSLFIAILCADFFYRWIERPSLRWSQKLKIYLRDRLLRQD